MDTRFDRTIFIRLFGREFLHFISSKRSRPEQTTEHTKAIQPPAPETSEKEPDSAPLFVINSLLLHECFKVLTREECEDLHALTGSILGNTRTLERIIPLRLSSQGVAGAAADDVSLLDQLVHLHDFGMQPLAYFHSHPGFGASATLPSGTDRRTQAAMEEGGGVILGGIFSRDGVVRFYANCRDPQVRVLGKKVQEVERNVYQLAVDEDVQETAAPRAVSRRERG